MNLSGTRNSVPTVKVPGVWKNIRFTFLHHMFKFLGTNMSRDFLGLIILINDCTLMLVWLGFEL